jgi:hypothetical protein
MPSSRANHVFIVLSYISVLADMHAWSIRYDITILRCIIIYLTIALAPWGLRDRRTGGDFIACSPLYFAWRKANFIFYQNKQVKTKHWHVQSIYLDSRSQRRHCVNKRDITNVSTCISYATSKIHLLNMEPLFVIQVTFPNGNVPLYINHQTDIVEPSAKTRSARTGIIYLYVYYRQWTNQYLVVKYSIFNFSVSLLRSRLALGKGGPINDVTILTGLSCYM